MGGAGATGGGQGCLATHTRRRYVDRGARHHLLVLHNATCHSPEEATAGSWRIRRSPPIMFSNHWHQRAQCHPSRPSPTRISPCPGSATATSYAALSLCTEMMPYMSKTPTTPCKALETSSGPLSISGVKTPPTGTNSCKETRKRLRSTRARL